MTAEQKYTGMLGVPPGEFPHVQTALEVGSNLWVVACPHCDGVHKFAGVAGAVRHAPCQPVPIESHSFDVSHFILLAPKARGARMSVLNKHRKWNKTYLELWLASAREDLDASDRIFQEMDMDASKNDIVRFHQNGASRSISTNAASEESFIREVEVILRQRTQSVGEFEAGWLKPIIDIVCRLRGYKSDVVEHRVIVAGEWVPEDVVDALAVRPGPRA